MAGESVKTLVIVIQLLLLTVLEVGMILVALL